jgi:hypothetical protein
MKDPVGLPVALIQLSDFWKPFSKETGDAPLHFPVFFRHHYGEIGLSRGLQRIAMSPSCLVEKDLRPLLFCPFSEALEGGDPLSPQVALPCPPFPCISGTDLLFLWPQRCLPLVKPSPRFGSLSSSSFSSSASLLFFVERPAVSSHARSKQSPFLIVDFTQYFV